MTAFPESAPLRVLADGAHIGPQSKGVGLYTRAILEQMVLLDPASEFFVPVTFEPSSSPQLELPGVTNVSVTWDNHFWHGFRTIPRLADRLDPSVIWWPYETPASTSGVPFAMSCHDVPGEIRQAQQRGGDPLPRLKSRIRDWIDDRMLGRTLRHAALVFCNSSYVARRISSDFGVSSKRIRLAPCAPAVDYASLSKSVKPDLIRRRLDCPDGFVLAFYTGDRRENPLVLPPMFDHLVRAGHAENLVVAGVKPELEDSVEQLFSPYSWRRRLRLLPFFGYNQEARLAELYTAASLYLDPSLHEGFGMQVLEAMACGTPVVCSDRGALPEVTSGAARLVDAEDPLDICRRVAVVLAQPDLRREMALAGRARASEFSWSSTARVVFDGLREVAVHAKGDPRQGILSGGFNP